MSPEKNNNQEVVAEIDKKKGLEQFYIDIAENNIKPNREIVHIVKKGETFAQIAQEKVKLGDRVRASSLDIGTIKPGDKVIFQEFKFGNHILYKYRLNDGKNIKSANGKWDSILAPGDETENAIKARKHLNQERETKRQKEEERIMLGLDILEQEGFKISDLKKYRSHLSYRGLELNMNFQYDGALKAAKVLYRILKIYDENFGNKTEKPKFILKGTDIYVDDNKFFGLNDTKYLEGYGKNFENTFGGGPKSRIETIGILKDFLNEAILLKYGNPIKKEVKIGDIYEEFKIEKKNNSLTILGVTLNENTKNGLYINNTLTDCIVNFLYDYNKNISKKDNFTTNYFFKRNYFEISGKTYDDIFSKIINEWINNIVEIEKKWVEEELKKYENSKILDLDDVEGKLRIYLTSLENREFNEDTIVFLDKKLEKNVKIVTKFLNKVIANKYSK